MHSSSGARSWGVFLAAPVPPRSNEGRRPGIQRYTVWTTKLSGEPQQRPRQLTLVLNIDSANLNPLSSIPHLIPDAPRPCLPLQRSTLERSARGRIPVWTNHPFPCAGPDRGRHSGVRSSSRCQGPCLDVSGRTTRFGKKIRWQIVLFLK